MILLLLLLLLLLNIRILNLISMFLFFHDGYSSTKIPFSLPDPLRLVTTLPRYINCSALSVATSTLSVAMFEFVLAVHF